jgi:hypothetical protein
MAVLLPQLSWSLGALNCVCRCAAAEAVGAELAGRPAALRQSQPMSAAVSVPVDPKAKWLGYAGLLPFLAGAAGVWWLPVGSNAMAGAGLAAYAAVIVSFLGGIHWGLGFRDRTSLSFVWSVVPSLLAWGALLLPQLSWSLGASALSLLLCWAVDRQRYASCGLAAWLPMRHTLTAVAVLCCFVGAAGM